MFSEIKMVVDVYLMGPVPVSPNFWGEVKTQSDNPPPHVGLMNNYTVTNIHSIV